MKLLALKENTENENRTAITPELISKYQKIGFEIYIESQAGQKAGFSDAEYEKLGAKILTESSIQLSEFDVIISVQRNDLDFSKTKTGVVFASLSKDQESSSLNENKKNIFAFALEFLPRITRAQSFDVLSSQSNLAGYRAVIDAVYEMQKCVPMMMTAAGTISAAKFMIIGAGVAGLQAIATAKRLGGIVCAFDVRSAAKEQVQSLGAKFIEVATDEKVETAYAKEMSEDYKKKQQELLYETIKNQDVVILTALIPGKKAPILVSKQMVQSMKTGSIIVDLAAVNGGNCELTVAGKVVELEGVKIIGYKNFPSRVSFDSTRLFAKNIFNFIEFLVDKTAGKILINGEDEIIKSTRII